MTRTRAAWCGIDVGTQGVRALILDADGVHRGVGACQIPPGHRVGDRHEQDAGSWWTALVGAVHQAVTAAAGVELQAVALDATSGTVLVEGADGAARGPALMYDDARATRQARKAQLVGEELWSALGYRIQSSWALPKVMWLIASDAVGHGDRVVHQSDHLLRQLTGTAVVTDSSHALKTGVDLRGPNWPVDIFADLSVPLTVLPDVVLPGALLGRVSAEAATATGLPAGLPVRAGMTDGCASQIATGALALGSWSSALGTTLVIKGSTADLVRDPSGGVYCHRSPDGGWLPGGASNTGAGVLTRAFPGAGPAEFDALTAAARGLGVPPGVTYSLVGEGERFPFVTPYARSFSHGVPENPAHRFNALCHGIAYVERFAYDVLGTLGADVNGPVSVSGGGTRNVWWNQVRADVLGRPLLLPASVEAAAGMAVLAASEPGQLAATARRLVTVRQRVEPSPDRAVQLRAGYERLVGALVDRGWVDGSLAARALETRPVSGGAW